MGEGNKIIKIKSFDFPRACLTKVESEALVSTDDFRVNEPCLGKSLLPNFYKFLLRVYN